MGGNNNKNLTPWKKGQSGNPEGGRLHDQNLKQIRRLTRSEIAEVGTLLLEKNFTEVEAISKDPNTSILKLMTCAIVQKALTGSENAYRVIIEQIVGKPKQSVSIDGEVGMVHYTADQKRRIAEAYLKEVRELDE